MLRSTALAVCFLGALTGCYRSHERAAGSDAGTPRDGARDTGARDAGADAAELDAGPIGCDALAVTESVALDEGVTPRIAALPGGHVGVVYVRTDGSPTRVLYERLDDALVRLTGAVTVATDSFTWAELALSGGDVLIAYGTGGAASAIARVTLDGAASGPTRRVPLDHPSIFRVGADGIFWGAFAMRDDNSLELAQVALDGTLRHPVESIPLGRYGSGHGALLREDGRSLVLAYPREGPRGVRRGYVNAITSGGVLGPERRLEDEDDRAVVPVQQGGSLVLVRRGDALVVERAELDTLEHLERSTFPPIEASPLAAAVADRLVVAHAVGSSLRVDDFGTDLAGFERHEIALPTRTTGNGSSIAAFPGALVIALTLVDGARTYPWLVRLECRAE